MQGCYLCPKEPELIKKHKFIKELVKILPYSLLERQTTTFFSTLPVVNVIKLFSVGNLDVGIYPKI